MGSRGRRPRIEQLALFRHGGARSGAGRKPSGPRGLTPHAKRPRRAAYWPVLVTARLCESLPPLRRPPEFDVLARSFRAASARQGFRVIHASVQTNHVHVIVEADDAIRMERGMIGLLTRIARGLNALWQRRGRVFADRHHTRVLRSPREVRNALVYVLHNARKHGCGVRGIDPYSSGPWFDGWSVERTEAAAPGPSPFAAPMSWLSSQGWRQLGPIRLDESPASVRAKWNEIQELAHTRRSRPRSANSATGLEPGASGPGHGHAGRGSRWPPHR